MKDIYILIETKPFRLIMRNLWHKNTSGGVYLIKIGKTHHRDRNEYLLTLIGFELALFIN